LSNEDALLKEIVERGTLKKDNLRGRLSDVITSFKTTWGFGCTSE
jgi:hypothetical protein